MPRKRATPRDTEPPGTVAQVEMESVDLPDPQPEAEESLAGWRVARSITVYERCEPSAMRAWLTEARLLPMWQVVDFGAPRFGSLMQYLNTWDVDDLGAVVHKRLLSGLQRCEFGACWDPDLIGPRWHVETIEQEGMDGGSHHEHGLWDRADFARAHAAH